MEIYLTIDEYMDTFFGLLSAIGSLAAGFAAIWAISLAKGYLDEHKNKVILERRFDSAKQIIQTYYEIEMISADVFRKINWESIINNTTKYQDHSLGGFTKEFEVCKSILIEYWKVRHEVIAKFSYINVLLEVLQNNDLEKLHKSAQEKYIMIFNSINLLHDYLEFNLQVNEDLAGRELVDLIRTIRKKINSERPRDFYSFEITTVKNYHDEIGLIRTKVRSDYFKEK